jgi:hypothetical protein
MQFRDIICLYKAMIYARTGASVAPGNSGFYEEIIDICNFSFPRRDRTVPIAAPFKGRPALQSQSASDPQSIGGNPRTDAPPGGSCE